MLTECSVQLGFWSLLEIRLATPLVIVGAIWIISGTKFLIEKKLHFKVDSTLLRSTFVECLSSLNFVFNILYAYVLSGLFQAFNCSKQLNGTYTLNPSPSLICFNSEWNSHLPLIISFLVIYVCLYPSFLLYLYVHYRNSLDHPIFQKICSTTTSGYTRTCFWWELMSMLKKCWLSLAFNIFSLFLSSYSKNFAVLSILFISLIFELLFTPFKTKSENRLNFL
jgi:hypothetical protein